MSLTLFNDFNFLLSMYSEIFFFPNFTVTRTETKEISE